MAELGGCSKPHERCTLVRKPQSLGKEARMVCKTMAEKLIGSSQTIAD